MFLLNSQDPLVTATRGSTGFPQNRRHPLSRSYGANLPSSLAWVSPHKPWAPHPGAPVSVLGTVAEVRSRTPFQGRRGSAEPPNGGHSSLQPVLAVTALPGLRVVSRGGCLGRPTSTRQGSGLRCRTYLRGTGILTRFPFGRTELRPALGPANPQLTTVAEEPWPFRPWGFSPHFAVTTAGIRTRDGSIGPHGPTSTPSRRPPTGSRPHGGRAPGSRRPA